ncbi:hypothetical protein CLHOM_26740 [Clostridium homopropionicum DSM 5847]|uniref:PsbP C-terminal domain-containing protein n=1 Tax=Clostridium homopropionicum DSM 5847 TaxID=1121318 RepID=A0A0L6Z7J3_9CLOT|nr:hypothetical protein [Clostridium homopropionicum]KOA18934.1 hypothetical protein CLHOM_26740 [Clostridium homopropionicum DSM 5847]SFG44066.1 hypothetical protein SAMN04488501_10981 [Clostridium homopropionicum]
MKIIIMNKRKLEVFFTLMLLMGVLFGTGEMLKGHLKTVSFMQNNIRQLKEYTGLGGSLKYKLPEEWSTSDRIFSGNEIVYHKDFTSKDLTINGFVQVWREQQDLKSFLDKSKEVSEKQNIIKNYSALPLKLDNKVGYLVKYVMESNDTDYVAYEYFIKEPKGFLRFSFFMKSKDFKEDMVALFDSIVKTASLK